MSSAKPLVVRKSTNKVAPKRKNVSLLDDILNGMAKKPVTATKVSHRKNAPEAKRAKIENKENAPRVSPIPKYDHMAQVERSRGLMMKSNENKTTPPRIESPPVPMAPVEQSNNPKEKPEIEEETEDQRIARLRAEARARRALEPKMFDWSLQDEIMAELDKFFGIY